MVEIRLDKECDCPKDYCEAMCDNPLDCIYRLRGEVIVKCCEICKAKTGCCGTWHHEGICLSCKYYDLKGVPAMEVHNG